ncbi:hypothetical protein [Colwellia sp. 75C3]|nr:hypothetical protein [Colwellia sp. 75C3]
MNTKDISQAALFKDVNLDKKESKNRSKIMIQYYKELGGNLKGKSSFTRR